MEAELRSACERGKEKKVRKLLTNSTINLNCRSRNLKLTPLHLACEKQHPNIIQLLLNDKRVDVNQADRDGITPFYLACAQNSSPAVKLLLKDTRVDVNKSQNDGTTPLIYAIENEYIEIVELLLKDQRVDVNKADKNRATPLIVAGEKGYLRVVKLLLMDKRIDVNKVDKGNRTIFYHACGFGDINIVKELLNDERVDINKAKNDGLTPFMIACFNGHDEIIRYILASGREVNLIAKDKDGKDAIDYAKKQKHLVIVGLLESFKNNSKETRTKLRSQLGLGDVNTLGPNEKKIEEKKDEEHEKEKNRIEKILTKLEEEQKKFELDRKKEQDQKLEAERKEIEEKKKFDEDKKILEIEQRRIEEKMKKIEERTKDIEERTKKIEENKKEIEERTKNIEEIMKRIEEEKKKLQEENKKLEEEKNRKLQELVYEIEYKNTFYKLKNQPQTFSEFESAIKLKIKLEEKDPIFLHYRENEKLYVLNDMEDLKDLREGTTIIASTSTQNQGNSNFIDNQIVPAQLKNWNELVFLSQESNSEFHVEIDPDDIPQNIKPQILQKMEDFSKSCQRFQSTPSKIIFQLEFETKTKAEEIYNELVKLYQSNSKSKK